MTVHLALIFLSTWKKSSSSLAINKRFLCLQLNFNEHKRLYNVLVEFYRIISIVLHVNFSNYCFSRSCLFPVKKKPLFWAKTLRNILNRSFVTVISLRTSCVAFFLDFS